MKLQNQIRALMLNTSHPFFQFNDIAYPIGDSLALLFIALPFFKWANCGLFFVYFRLFKETIQFLQEINVKNVHPVYSAGI